LLPDYDFSKVSVDDLVMACVNKGHRVGSRGPSLARAGKGEAARKWMCLNSSFPIYKYISTVYTILFFQCLSHKKRKYVSHLSISDCGKHTHQEETAPLTSHLSDTSIEILTYIFGREVCARQCSRITIIKAYYPSSIVI